MQIVSNTIAKVKAWADTAYSGASVMRKELSQWLPTTQPADAELLPEQEMLIARARDLGRNHGIASSNNQTQVDNIVGTGLRLAATPDYFAMGKSIEWAELWSRKTEVMWRAWSESCYFDAARKQSFNAMTSLVLRTAITSGEVYALPLWIEDSRTPFATTFQLLEGDRIGNPDMQPDTMRMRGGIEINEYGEELAYYIRHAANNDFWLMPGMYLSTGRWERIPAQTEWGRKRVLHIYDQDRPGQTHGKPSLSSVLEQFKMLDHYQRVELQSSIVNALVAGVIETPLDQAQIADMMGKDPNAYLAQKNQWHTQLKGGAIIPLYPGDKFNSFMPTRPNSQYAEFVMTILRHIAASQNIPYELLVKDFSKTNYSSARAALLEAWRFFTGRRKWIEEQWAKPVYQLWLEEAVAKGLIEAPDFYENRHFYIRSKWIGAGRGWIDPVKEAQAAVVRMQAGISTLEAECAEQGNDWQDTLEQKAREYARMKLLGVYDELIGVEAPNETNAPQKPTGKKKSTRQRAVGGDTDKTGEEYGE